MIPGNANPLLLATAADAAAAAVATKSLRFNSGDSAYLNRTPSSAGNRKTWTWSGWVKRSGLTSGADLLFAVYQDSSNRGYIQFQASTDKILLFKRIGGTDKYEYSTDAVFRDPSAWYHIVVAFDTTQATASNRVKIYVNGVEQSLTATTTAAQNLDTLFNAAQPHYVGRDGASQYFDGYFADVHFIDGSALDPTSFGAYDDNGVWQAAAYSGTYGTNGFHLLDFANESTVGHDSSGNENDFTANNISTSAGAGNDVLFDVPTNGDQSDTGAGGEVSGNYCTLNPLDQNGGTLSNGNLDYDLGSGTKFSSGTIAVKSGKWFWEAKAVSGVTSGSVGGRFAISQTPTETHGENGPFTLFWHATGGIRTAINGTITSRATGTNYADGDILGLALDADANIAYFYKNGSLAYTYDFSSLVAAGSQFLTPSCWNGSNGSPVWTYNFGQRPFAYSARTNHKCLVSTNLPTPTIADGSDYFEAKQYDGSGSTQSITGLEFSPSFVWIKPRNVSDHHVLYDTVRGVRKQLYSNLTNAEETETQGLSAFTSDGFTLGGNHTVRGATNESGETYMSWNWDAGSSTVSNTDGSITSSVRANQTAGFSIVAYTGTGGTSDFGHGLNVKPSLVIIKSRSTSTHFWIVGHSGLSSNQVLYLNTNIAAETITSENHGGVDLVNSTSSTVKLLAGQQSADSVNRSGDNFIAYCFAPVDGFSSMGSYEGTGSASTGAFVFCNFRPALVLIKRDGSANWCIYDTTRDPFNDATHVLSPDTNAGGNGNDAFVSDVSIDILSNGFKIVDVDGEINQSGDTYVYYAVAENPFQANGGLAR